MEVQAHQNLMITLEQFLKEIIPILSDCSSFSLHLAQCSSRRLKLQFPKVGIAVPEEWTRMEVRNCIILQIVIGPETDLGDLETKDQLSPRNAVDTIVLSYPAPSQKTDVQLTVVLDEFNFIRSLYSLY